MIAPSFPARYDSAGNKLRSLVGAALFVVGRRETADLTVLDVTCSRQQFRVVGLSCQGDPEHGDE